MLHLYLLVRHFCLLTADADVLGTHFLSKLNWEIN